MLLASVVTLVVAGCGGGSDESSEASNATVDSVDEAPATDAPATTSAPTQAAESTSTTAAPIPPDHPDVANVWFGASLMDVSTEYDNSTWSAINLIARSCRYRMVGRRS